MYNDTIEIETKSFSTHLSLNAESFILINYNKKKRLFYTEKVIDHLSIEEEIV